MQNTVLLNGKLGSELSGQSDYRILPIKLQNDPMKAFVCRVKEFKLAELAISILEERLIEVDITQREIAAQQLESQKIALVSEIEARF